MMASDTLSVRSRASPARVPPVRRDWQVRIPMPSPNTALRISMVWASSLQMDDILTGPTTVSLGAHTRGRGWLRGREHRLPLPGLSARDSQAENQVPEGPQGPGNHPLLAPQGHDYLLRMPPGGCGQLWRNGQRDSHAISAHAPVLVCRGDRGVVSVGAVSYVFELLDESPRPPKAPRRTGPPGWSLGLTASILLHALLAAVAWAISVPPSSHQGPELALLLEERDLEPRLRKG